MFKKSSLLFILTISLLLLRPPAPRAGEFYKWINKNGVINFADNLLKVPPEYRDQMEKREVRDPAIKKSAGPPPLRKEKKAEPEKKKQKSVSRGQAVFKEKCAKCHSLTGKDPNKNATPLTGLMNRKFFKEYVAVVTEENIKKVIIKGGWDDMPAFPDLEYDGIFDLMEYLRPYMKKKK